MYKKILLSIVLLVFCFSNSNAVNGFFFEGGIGSRLINGGMDYELRGGSDYQSDFELSRDPLNEAPIVNSVTDSDTFGWKSRMLTNYNATIGFRLSQKLVTSLSIHYVHNKAGYGIGNSNNFPNINTELGENIQRNGLMKIESNWFSQMNLRATQNIYFDKSFFIIAGVEYSSLKLQFQDEDKIEVSVNEETGLTRSIRTQGTFKANTYGFLAGIGYELSISNKVSIMTSGLFSFSSYQGDELYYDELDFNLGGLELGYTLRYYLK